MIALVRAPDICSERFTRNRTMLNRLACASLPMTISTKPNGSRRGRMAGEGSPVNLFLGGWVKWGEGNFRAGVLKAKRGARGGGQIPPGPPAPPGPAPPAPPLL